MGQEARRGQKPGCHCLSSPQRSVSREDKAGTSTAYKEKTTSFKSAGWLSLNLHTPSLPANCHGTATGTKESPHCVSHQCSVLVQNCAVAEQRKRLPKEAAEAQNQPRVSMVQQFCGSFCTQPSLKLLQYSSENLGQQNLLGSSFKLLIHCYVRAKTMV